MSTKRIILLLIAGIFVVIAVVCNVIAFFTDYWLQSSSLNQEDFLNLGLWDACFHDYVHEHENLPKTYDGCHPISSKYYRTIQPWLRPCESLYFITLSVSKTVFTYLFSPHHSLAGGLSGVGCDWIGPSDCGSGVHNHLVHLGGLQVYLWSR